MLAREELAVAAVSSHEQHALETPGVLVQRDARLPHQVERSPAALIATTVADVEHRPRVVQQVGRRAATLGIRQRNGGQRSCRVDELAALRAAGRPPAAAVVQPERCAEWHEEQCRDREQYTAAAARVARRCHAPCPAGGARRRLIATNATTTVAPSANHWNA